jgi:hypothetical protein
MNSLLEHVNLRDLRAEVNSVSLYDFLLIRNRLEYCAPVDRILEQQALHRFFYLHESKKDIMAQLNITALELEMILRKKKRNG